MTNLMSGSYNLISTLMSLGRGGAEEGRTIQTFRTVLLQQQKSSVSKRSLGGLNHGSGRYH